IFQVKTLDLRLGAGMDLLAELTDLREFSYLYEGHQQIGVEEALWIKEHWTRLGTFEGYPNPKSSVREQIREVLKLITIEDT
ncbi:hypothetical protein BGZ65_012691, partial [Modicella reniformis]